MVQLCSSEDEIWLQLQREMEDGRPKDEHNIAALARSYSTEAIETLVELMRNARDDRVRGTAAQALLDRGFGKPKVEIQNTNTDFRDTLEQVQLFISDSAASR